MKLPNAEKAIIDPAKLREYILSRSHPIGRFKATFFLQMGYTAESWDRLEADLRAQHLGLDVDSLVETGYGTKYRIRGTLVGPARRSATVDSIWIVLTGEDCPRFVTAYPGGTS